MGFNWNALFSNHRHHGGMNLGNLLRNGAMFAGAAQALSTRYQQHTTNNNGNMYQHHQYAHNGTAPSNNDQHGNGNCGISSGDLNGNTNAQSFNNNANGGNPGDEAPGCDPRQLGKRSQKSPILVAVIACAATFFILYALSHFSNRTIDIVVGETRRLQNPPPFLTRSLDVKVKSSTGAGVVIFYGFEKSCPSLTGTANEVQTSTSRSLQPNEYTYDTYDLNKGSSIDLTTTVSQGYVMQYYFAGKDHASLLSDIDNQQKREIDSSYVQSLAKQSKLIQADDGAIEASWNSLQKTTKYSLVFHNVGSSSSAEFQTEYVLSRSTYDLSSSSSHALETCSLDTSSSKSHCPLSVSSDIACWIATVVSKSDGGNDDGDGGNVEYDNIVTTIKVSSSRNWGWIITFSALPLFCALLIQGCNDQNGGASSSSSSFNNASTSHSGTNNSNNTTGISDDGHYQASGNTAVSQPVSSVGYQDMSAMVPMQPPPQGHSQYPVHGQPNDGNGTYNQQSPDHHQHHHHQPNSFSVPQQQMYQGGGYAGNMTSAPQAQCISTGANPLDYEKPPHPYHSTHLTIPPHQMPPASAPQHPSSGNGNINNMHVPMAPPDSSNWDSNGYYHRQGGPSSGPYQEPVAVPMDSSGTIYNSNPTSPSSQANGILLVNGMIPTVMGTSVNSPYHR